MWSFHIFRFHNWLSKTLYFTSPIVRVPNVGEFPSTQGAESYYKGGDEITTFNEGHRDAERMTGEDLFSAGKRSYGEGCIETGL